MRPVFITAEAQRDLSEIHAYLRREASFQADDVLERLEKSCQDLAIRAMAFALLPGREERDVHRRVVYPYYVLYRVRDEQVEILHVLHGARDIDPLLFREG